MTYCFDTSALVKRYLSETGSAWVESICTPVSGHTIAVCRLAQVELQSAVTRKELRGDIAPPVALAARTMMAATASQYLWLHVDPLIVQAAQLCPTHQLRALDSIQLAAALVLRTNLVADGLPEPVFVSADARLLQVAAQLGLLTEDPLHHP